MHICSSYCSGFQFPKYSFLNPRLLAVDVKRFDRSVVYAAGILSSLRVSIAINDGSSFAALLPFLIFNSQIKNNTYGMKVTPSKRLARTPLSGGLPKVTCCCGWLITQ